MKRRLNPPPKDKNKSREKKIETDPIDQARRFLKESLELRYYQECGVRWLISRGNPGNLISGGILADEMGLGKTVQTIAMIAATCKIGRCTLIVTPLSVMYQWASEIKKFSSFEPIVYHGASRKRSITDKIRKDRHNIILTTYGIIVEEEKRNRTVGNMRIVMSWMFSINWQHLVLDEGHEIRTQKTKRYKAIRKLKADSKYALTGTPVHNSANDFMTLMVFIGMPEETLKNVKKRLGYKLSRKEALRTLKEYSDEYMLRRVKSGIPSLVLPRKKQWMTELYLSHAEQEIYNGVHTKCVIQFNTFLREGTVMENYAYILVMINKLRRAACHPLLGIPSNNRADILSTKDIKPSTKVVAMMRDIKRYVFQEKRKIVLFSQWTSMLDIIQHFLVKERIKFARYDGQMKVSDRGDALVKFKTEPAVGIILVSLKAGGQGLNLCEGSVAMFADHWWNGAAEDQATDRIHRIGQTKPVDVIRYTTRNTIEENVLALQRKKRVHEIAITGNDAEIAKLNVEDLTLLFKIPD